MFASSWLASWMIYALGIAKVVFAVILIAIIARFLVIKLSRRRDPPSDAK